MGPLSDRDLRLVIKSLGITANALTVKLERVDGINNDVYDTTSEELDAVEDLIRRYKDEQSRRRHKRSA